MAEMLVLQDENGVTFAFNTRHITVIGVSQLLPTVELTVHCGGILYEGLTIPRFGDSVNAQAQHRELLRFFEELAA